MSALPGPGRPALRFDRAEWSGAFGDVGTDLPLLLALIAATGFSAGPVFVAFGTALVLSGWLYRLPMPVQPLKAMTVVVLAGQATGPQLQLGGILLGLAVLALAASGALGWLARVIPLWVVRGVQAGLAFNLALAAGRMAGREGAWGWAAAAAAVAAVVLLRRSTRWPAGLLVVGAGALWTLPAAGAGFAPGLPVLPVLWPELPWADWPVVLAVLVLPQLPLSLANSLVATERTVSDLFPGRAVRIRGLGFTFGLLNLLAPFLGGVPVCHGCGGLAGHFALGARTGGSVVIYGGLLALGGLFAADFLGAFVRAFPFPLLGALLAVEAAVLLALGRDQLAQPARVVGVGLVGLACVLLPYGYLLGVVAGTLLHHGLERLPLRRAA
jgi:hypothetical protein